MVWFVLGILILIVAIIGFIVAARSSKKLEDENVRGIDRDDTALTRTIARIAAWVLIVVAAVFVFLGSFFTQDVGQSSVLVDATGNVVGEESSSGFHLKAPWVNPVTFDVRNQRVVFVNPQTSTGDNSGGQADGREIAVIDTDGVDSNVDVTVRYNLDPQKVTDIYKAYKDEDKLKSTLIFNDIRSVVRSEAGKLHTLDLLTDRTKLQDKIREELDSRWSTQGVLIDEVSLQQIDPPKSVKDAYAVAQKSQIEVQKAQNDLAATKVSAQQQVVQAQAEADANNLLNASLTPNVLTSKYYDTLKQIGDKGNLVVVPQGSTPLINTK